MWGYIPNSSYSYKSHLHSSEESLNICFVLQGDVQMRVSCLLVLGEKAKGLVDDKTIEHWFSSYIGIIMKQ